MRSIPNNSLLKKQISSRRDQINIYIILVLMILSIANLIYQHSYLSEGIILGILILTYIFYIILGIFIHNPQSLSLNNLKIYFYFFIITLVLAIGFDVYYREGLYYRVFLEAVMAVVGIILLHQTLITCQSMIKQP